MNDYKKKNEGFCVIDSEHFKRMVQYEVNNPCISETTGCPTKHDSWRIVLNVFFYNLLSSLIPKRIIKISHGSQITVKLISK